MKDSDGMLALLQDIKELLWGIALLSAGGFLCLIGIVIGDWGIALLAVGIFVFLAGALCAYHGFNHHEVVEHLN